MCHMWDIKQKQQMNKPNKQTHRYGHRMIVMRGKGQEVGEGKQGQGVQICGGGGRLDFGWWAHSGLYR